MAIWQFDVCILPRGAPEPLQGPDGYDARPVSAPATAQAMAWCGEQWPRHTWSDDLFVYGEDEGCRIDVLVTEDGSAELLARIDLRAPHGEFCRSVCQLAARLDCVLFSPELWRLIAPDADELLAATRRSRAARFVQDPRAVLGESL